MWGVRLGFRTPAPPGWHWDREAALVKDIYRVPGVNCQNCVRHITEELVKIPGVGSVEVNLEAKTVTVEHDGAVSDQQMRAGIEEAGYEVAA